VSQCDVIGSTFEKKLLDGLCITLELIAWMLLRMFVRYQRTQLHGSMRFDELECLNVSSITRIL
jgi:hypothetical protein